MIEFRLTKKEEEEAIEFKSKHKHPEINKGTIGGTIRYIFTPTSIGNSVLIKCSICDAQKNITDYDAW